MSRIGCACDLVPDTDRLEQVARRGDDGGCARIDTGAPERGVGDGDREGGPETLAQRNCQREAGKARAADQHVDTLLRHELTPLDNT